MVLQIGSKSVVYFPLRHADGVSDIEEDGCDAGGWQNDQVTGPGNGFRQEQQVHQGLVK